MPEFPKKEMDIIELAQKIANGITKNPTDFPNPPVLPADMETSITAFFDKIEAIQLSKAATMGLVQDKNDILKNIVGGSKANIGYAEIVAKGDNAMLEKISWSVRAEPTALQPPAQCRFLEIIGQGDGWVHIDWKEPVGGGKVATYVVQRSQNGTSFTDVAPAVESEAVLNNQPTGKYIFQVVAMNKAGRGMASNTISITF